MTPKQLIILSQIAGRLGTISKIVLDTSCNDSNLIKQCAEKIMEIVHDDINKNMAEYVPSSQEIAEHPFGLNPIVP